MMLIMGGNCGYIYKCLFTIGTASTSSISVSNGTIMIMVMMMVTSDDDNGEL